MTEHTDGPRLLAVERALRAAARAGNRMLAGGIASVDVTDSASSAALRSSLTRMGVRIVDGRDPRVEFAFGDTVVGGPEAVIRASRTEAPRSGADVPGAQLRADPLPRVSVGLDGTIDSPRGSDAAAKIAWAARGMPTTATLAAALRTATGAAVPRIAVSLVLEPKTAAFTLALAEAGCAVALFSAVSETDPEVAAALAATGKVAVFAPLAPVSGNGVARAMDAAHAAAVLDWAPELLIDDGSHLVRLAHSERQLALTTLRAAAEETTSGVRPLHEMAATGELRIPVIAVNDARTKTGFDNLIGTGQSCVFAVADVWDAATADYRGIAGTHWAVLGYGPVGQGVARFAAALGAEITVVEQDPVRALAALHDGFGANTSAAALPQADVVVSATGVWHTLDVEGFALLRPGAVVAVAGGIDDELALEALAAAGWSVTETAPRVAEWRAPNSHETPSSQRAGVGRPPAGPLVLAEGGGVNYSAGEGNPIEVMDLSFATQLAALLRLLTEELPPGVHTLSEADEVLVARAALAARGGEADPTPPRSRAGGAAQPWHVHRYRATPDRGR
ncbi:adenosylhomocysteinase [Leucobacter luti]|uniref:adenosylhomocysteinase n=1 Tax=Leucobacter luti TaxID=340320 RepID=UPI001FB4B0F1|nr:adenosylhomocysteinase [Leucobacter luti]MCW2287447.1 adenosylhomocysteinase [Leucobacter luti]